MAGLPNPFAGLGQVDGSAASVGRGRGTQGRAGSHVSRNPGPSRGGHPRGRGRGGGPPAGRSGRGRGGPASNTWRRKPESTPANETPGSPFAQMKQHRPGSPFSGGQPPSRSSPFGSVAKGPGGFGMASSFENRVDSSRDPRLRASAQAVNGTGGIPVENPAILNSYNDRFEQVCDFEMRIRRGYMSTNRRIAQNR